MEIDNFDQTFSDGIWHTLDLSMGPNRVRNSFLSFEDIISRLVGQLCDWEEKLKMKQRQKEKEEGKGIEEMKTKY